MVGCCYIYGCYYILWVIHMSTRKYTTNTKQLLDEVLMISGIINLEVSVIARSRRLRPITFAETLIIPDIIKTEFNNCFNIHCLCGLNEFQQQQVNED